MILLTGEILGVLNPRERGVITAHSQMTFSVAGAEFNVAVALARLGESVGFSGLVGADAVGRVARQILRQEGVDTTWLATTTEYPSGLYFKEFYGIGDEPRVYYHRRASAATHWVPPTADQMTRVGWIHTTGITAMLDDGLRQRLLAWLRALPPTTTISLDINYRHKLGSLTAWQQALRMMLPVCRMIFGSPAEWETLTGTRDPKALLAEGIINREQTLVLKDGNEAQVVQAGESVAVRPALRVPTVVDVVGAGDGFAAGVIAGYRQTGDWETALAWGHVVGAYAVRHPGDWEGYPTRNEVRGVLG